MYEVFLFQMFYSKSRTFHKNPNLKSTMCQLNNHKEMRLRGTSRCRRPSTEQQTGSGRRNDPYWGRRAETLYSHDNLARPG